MDVRIQIDFDSKSQFNDATELNIRLDFHATIHLQCCDRCDGEKESLIDFSSRCGSLRNEIPMRKSAKNESSREKRKLLLRKKVFSFKEL